MSTIIFKLFSVYRDHDHLFDSIKDGGDVPGGVVELYAASHYEEYLKKFRIQTVFEQVYGYGVVLRPRTVKLSKCLKNHVLDSQREIYENIRRDFKPLTVYIVCV